MTYNLRLTFYLTV